MINSLKSKLDNLEYTWLITGAAGFIGSNLAEMLLTQDQRVIGLDNYSTGSRENTAYLKKFNKFEFIEGDITNLTICREATEGVDFVLHQAALGSIPRSINDPLNTNNSNINGFLNMLVASKEAKVKRFVYAGSSSTYGDHPNLPKVEDTIGRPLSPYSITKYVNELYADTFKKHYDLDSIGLRYFNVFGRRQRKEGAYAAVIPTWIMAILNNQEVKIYGDGTTSRDFCYIDNVIQANILAALTNKKESLNQIYNIALNDQTSLNDLFKIISESVKRVNKDVIIPEPIYKDFRAGDVKHSRADISKAQDLLNYRPTHFIREGILETVKWYMQEER